MGFYFRKSFGFGPLRINASKRGLGFSSGIPGARAGIDARGRAYVHCGLGGVYYRSFLSGKKQVPPVTQGGGDRPAERRNLSEGPQRRIESADVAGMVPDTAAGLLEELQRRSQILRWHIPFAYAGTLLAIMIFLMGNFFLGITIVAITASGTIALAIWTHYRKVLRIDYDLDNNVRQKYDEVLAAFDNLRRAQRLWVVESQADVNDRKYHAGATQLMGRTPVLASRELPRFIRSNVTPPMLPAGRERIYILPDRLLLIDGQRVGAIEFHELELSARTTRFVEDQLPPTDAEQVDRTWKFVNKQGDPDRRFRDNRELPVMHYGELKWSSPSGLNEVHHTSSPSAAALLAFAIGELKKVISHNPHD